MATFDNCSSPCSTSSYDRTNELNAENEEPNINRKNDTPSNTYSFIKEKLQEWELQDYIDIFIQEKITKEVFLTITEEHLKTLIKPFGDYYRFLIRRKEFLTSTTNHINPIPRALYKSGENLRNLLESSAIGIYVLKQRSLLSCSKDLSTIIVDHLLSANTKFIITKEQLIFWANEIKGIWKNEDVIDWYKPRGNGNPPSGKLYHRYTNRSQKLKSTVLTFQKENSVLQETEDKVAELFNAELATTNLNNKNRILYLWEQTFHYRRQNFITISEYFKNYLQLKTLLVVELVELDFKLLGISDTDSLIKKWPNLHQRIIDVAQKKKAASQYLNYQKKVPPEILAWRVFPYLFSPIFVKTGKNKPWKPSAEEQSESFITWINSIEELDLAINKQRQLCIKQKLTLQPFIIAIGLLSNIIAVYVNVDDQQIKFDTITEAVDFCWKLVYVLNAKYSAPCLPIWTFIQKEIYNCQTEDTNYQSVKWVIKALKETSTENIAVSSESGGEV